MDVETIISLFGGCEQIVKAFKEEQNANRSYLQIARMGDDDCSCMRDACGGLLGNLPRSGGNQQFFERVNQA